MRKVKLKRWVKVALYFLFIMILVISIKDMFTRKEVVNEEGKNYTCYGSIIKVCSGESYDVR